MVVLLPVAAVGPVAVRLNAQLCYAFICLGLVRSAEQEKASALL